MITKVCERCKKEFQADKPSRKFCSIDCANNWKRKLKERYCLNCWNLFRPIHSRNKYCCKECQYEARRTLQEIQCPMCSRIFKQKYSWQKFCSRDCVTEYNKTDERRDKLELAAQKREQETWYKWPCQLPQVKKSGRDISKINKWRWNILKEQWYKVLFEFPLWDYSYDLKVWSLLIEVNPSSTHNSTRAPAFEWSSNPKASNYHYNKYYYAKNRWYDCIMIWDWLSIDDVLEMISNKIIYQWPKRLHRYNIKSNIHILDAWYNKDEMITAWFVEIRDCGKETFSQPIEQDASNK